MSTPQYLLLTFATISQALRLEKACHKTGLPGQLIPTPWQITASCSMSWRCPLAAQEELLTLIRQEHLNYENLMAWSCDG